MTNRSLYGNCLLLIALFSLWPILHFANHNREQIDLVSLSFLTYVYGVTLLVVGLIFLVLHFAMGQNRPVSSAMATAMFSLLFFNYHIAYDGIVVAFSVLGLKQGENYAYLIIVLATCVFTLFFVNSRRVLDLLLIFVAIVNLLPAISLITYTLTTIDTTKKSNQELVLGTSLTKTPNIFHIILDAYARNDLLARNFDFDNTPFLDALKERGFYIASKSYSNYPSTFLSIASTVSMSYLATEKTVPFKNRKHFYEAIQGDNPVVKILRRHKYQYIFNGSVVWDGSRCSGQEDLCLSSGEAIQQAVMDMTPLRRFIKTSRPNTVTNIETRLGEVFSGQRPIYLFSHTLSPHPPRSFSSACEELGSGIKIEGIEGRKGLTDFWGDVKGYINDLKCVNSQVLHLLDAILLRDPDAVIIIHGDHGTAFEVDWSLPIDQWSTSQFEERFSIFMALKVPSNCSPYQTISPVNIYPLIFGCLTTDDAKLHQDVSYVSPHEKHRQYGKAHLFLRSKNKHIDKE